MTQRLTNALFAWNRRLFGMARMLYESDQMNGILATEVKAHIECTNSHSCSKFNSTSVYLMFLDLQSTDCIASSIPETTTSRAKLRCARVHCVRV